MTREAPFEFLQRDEVSIHDRAAPYGLDQVRDHLFLTRVLEMFNVFTATWKRTGVELDRSSISKSANNSSPYDAPYTIRSYK